MTAEIAIAFAHPEDRAGATAGDGMPDRISLRDHVVEVEIGAFQQERGRRQRLSFNVVVEVRAPGDVADDVDRILSYDRITEAIGAELDGDRLNLLETLAEHVAARILAEPQALRTFVRIEKLDLGPGALGVEIVRSAKDLHVEVEVEAPAPVVLFLSAAAVNSPALTNWLDGVEASGLPAVIAVDLPETAMPEAPHPAAARRIRLLEIEQNAWVLAARDPRCVVVDSRTELDWAAKKGRISVWAPSKMVLDAAHPPAGADPGPLALWLAGELGAARIIAVGTDLPGAEHRDLSETALLA